MFLKTENGTKRKCSKANDHANERYKFGAHPHQAFMPVFVRIRHRTQLKGVQAGSF